MTITQAHQFIGRWRRIFIPWPSPHTDTGAAQALERSFLGIAIGPLIPAYFAMSSDVLWPMYVVIPGSIIMFLSFLLSFRFRAAHRLLAAADAHHISDSQKHIYDKPVA